MQSSLLRRSLAVSVAVHAIAALALWLGGSGERPVARDTVDIELAPVAPAPEALPAEVAQPRPAPLAPAGAEPAAAVPSLPGSQEEAAVAAVDAGVDAPADAATDAPADARPKRHPRDAAADAAIDAPDDAGSDAPADAMNVAASDDAGAPDDAGKLAVAEDAGATADAGKVAVTEDAGATADATRIAEGSSAGSGSASGSGAGSNLGSGEGSAVAAGAATGSNTGSNTGSAALAAGAVTGSATGSNTGSAALAAGAATGSNTGSAVVAAGAATGSNTGSAASALTTGAGSGALDTAALAAALAAGAVPGATNEPAVAGAPTTAGTAANLLAYLPAGHVVTALIRFDRLRGSEWAAAAERLLRPMPDYRQLFGPRDANLAGKLDLLVISTPRPRDAAATTLVGKTPLARRPLRELLGQGGPVAWTATQSGLMGVRTGARTPDARVFVSPYRGWFLLAQPADLGPLAAARGNPDTIEATAAQPGWIAGLRDIERETQAASDDPRGPALVVTFGFGGKRFKIAEVGLGLGISSVPKPDRASLAMELVKQGWLVRGNLRFATEADASEAIAAVKKLQARVADSRAIQLVIGKPIAHVVASLAFAQTGPRVSYATSMSIADARALLAFAAAQVDAYFTSVAPPDKPAPAPAR